MTPDTVLIVALWIGGVAIIAYWCWIDARKHEGTGYKGEDDA